MTKSEFFEKNNISFAKAMEIFNDQKNKKGGTKSFDKFLASEHIELKFKVGDLIVLDSTKESLRNERWDHNVVFKIVMCHADDTFAYDMRALTPSARAVVGESVLATRAFVEDNCTLY